MYKISSAQDFARVAQELAERCLLAGAPKYQGTCITIGNFDGVHVGHQALLQRTVQRAEELHLLPVVLTFWPHPLAVLASSRAPALLSTQCERHELFEKYGIELVLELSFTRDLAALTPEEFVQHVLGPMECRQLVVGYDFSLGKGRAGNFDVLQNLGEQYAFGVERLDSVIVKDAVVSSTRVRNLVRTGEVWEVRALLGRHYHLCGAVIHGYGRGEGLGFPTANLELGATLVPRVGVYATWVHTGDGQKPLPAVTNVGYVPTFGNDALSVESFILEGSPQLYDKDIRLVFVQYIRDEQQFAHIGELKERIAKDVALARDILEVSAGESTSVA